MSANDFERCDGRTFAEFQEEILRIVAARFSRGFPVTLETDLKEAGLDSLGIVELVITVQIKLGAVIPDSELDDLCTPAAVALAAWKVLQKDEC